MSFIDLVDNNCTTKEEIEKSLKPEDFPLFQTVTVIDPDHKLRGKRGKVRGNQINVQVEFENIKNRAGNPKPVSFKPEQLRLEAVPKTWTPPSVPWDNQDTNSNRSHQNQDSEFAQKFREECVAGSAIDPDLYEAAIDILVDVEMLPGGDAHLPIHDALGWNQEKFTRFTHQVRSTLEAAAFRNEDGMVWQCKLSTPLLDKEGKVRKYETPISELSGGSRAYLPPIPKPIREKIAHRWGVVVPMEGSFWKWVFEAKLVPIVLTEGGKKALALLSQGIVAIGFYGCWNGTTNKDISGRSTVPELIEDFKPFAIAGRTFYIAMDKDSKPQTIKDVAAATNRLGACLEKVGCAVRVCQWEPKQGKGIDDFIVGGGDIDPLLANAPITTFAGKEYKSKNKQLLSFFDKEFGDRLRLNEMSLKIELDGKPKDLDTFFLDLADLYDMDIAENKAVRLAVRLARANGYSPVRDYLDSLPPGDPEFLDGLASRYFGNHDAMAAKLLRRTLIAAVARAYEPGCQHDAITILQSQKQGMFKSTFWNVLASEEFFTDALSSESNNKDEKLVMRSSWIIEYSEFESAYRKKEIDQIKGFISSRVDSIRVPYDREVSKFPRTCVLVGTTNKDEFLRDSTGDERRFWVIPIRQSIPLNEVKADREAIWAAARTAYLSGERWHLDHEENQELFEYTAQFKEYDPWTEELSGFLEFQKEVTLSEVFDKLGIQTHIRDKRVVSRVAALLRSMGWADKKTTKGKRVWYFLGDFNATNATQGLKANHSKDSMGGIKTQSNATLMPPTEEKAVMGGISNATHATLMPPTEIPSPQEVEGGEDWVALKIEKNKKNSEPPLNENEGITPKSPAQHGFTVNQQVRLTSEGKKWYRNRGWRFSETMTIASIDGPFITLADLKGKIHTIHGSMIQKIAPPIAVGDRVKYTEAAIARQLASREKFRISMGREDDTPWDADWEYRVDSIDADGTCHLKRLGGGKGSRKKELKAGYLEVVK